MLTPGWHTGQHTNALLAPWDPTGSSHLLPDWEGGDVQALGALGGQVGAVSLGGEEMAEGEQQGNECWGQSLGWGSQEQEPWWFCFLQQGHVPPRPLLEHLATRSLLWLGTVLIPRRTQMLSLPKSTRQATPKPAA